MNTNPQVNTQELFDLLILKGPDAYFAEPVTQLEHALQTAHFVSTHTDNPELIIGALIHDVGHLIEPEEGTQALGNPHHDQAGAIYLKSLGFGKEITDLVEHHVNAKRYLVSTDPLYKAKLSEASKQTLELQGGPMWPDEIQAFEAEPEFDNIIMVRICDEMAKIPGLEVPNLECYRTVVEAYLTTRHKIENE